MSPDGKKPTPYKRYYDIFSWIVTQLAFSFVTTPFIVLTLQNSIRIWGQVYFYCVFGTVIASAFFASPGKRWLLKKVKARTTKPAMSRNESQEDLQGAMLGVPVDPGREFDDMVDEIIEEVKRRRGSADLPTSDELRQQVKDTLIRRASEMGSGAKQTTGKSE